MARTRRMSAQAMAAQVRQVAAGQGGNALLEAMADGLDPAPAPTPGPWEVGYYTPTERFRATPEHVAVCRPDMSLVAVTGPTGCRQSEADARLMAAAPDLLAAIEQAASRCAAMQEGRYTGEPWSAEYLLATYREIEDGLREAVAKARGE